MKQPEYARKMVGMEATESLFRHYSPEFREKIFVPSLLMLKARHASHPEYPFPDTKFNPNTGAELGPASYDRLYTWILGRGAEACARHLDILSDLFGHELAMYRDMLAGFVDAATDTIIHILEANNGKCPFIVNRQYQAVDESGESITVERQLASPADLFCAKGLLGSGNPAKTATGRMLFDEYVKKCFAGKYSADQVEEDPLEISQGAFMLALGAFPYLLHDKNTKLADIGLALRIVSRVISTYYDSETRRFYEYADLSWKKRLGYCDPGHGIEFAGLAMQAIDVCAMTGDMTQTQQAEADRMIPTLVQILDTCTATGINKSLGGIHKSVNPDTGDVLNNDMPWWNLPETARTAARVVASASNTDVSKWAEGLLVFAADSYINYYTSSYFNFPYQTRSGETGEVIDRVPAVPEGDPLYHANLALIDALDVLGGTSP